jgi:hypothetical protein
MTRKKFENKNTGINLGQVIIPAGHPNPPEPHEIEAAWLLARHYQCTVEFLIPIDGFKVKTPDFQMLGLLWELKSPVSDSKRRCVSGQFDRASDQSKNIVFDARRTKLEDEFLLKRIDYELSKRKSVKRVIFISMEKIVIEIK